MSEHVTQDEMDELLRLLHDMMKDNFKHSQADVYHELFNINQGHYYVPLAKSADS